MRELISSEVDLVSGGGLWDAVLGWAVGKALDYESSHIVAQGEAYGQYYIATGGLAAYGY